MTSQKDTILNLLRNTPEGINSIYVRNAFFIVDVATRIKELKEDGYVIGKTVEKNKTATYYLIDEPYSKQEKQPITKPILRDEDYDWSNGVARLKADMKPEQRSWL